MRSVVVATILAAAWLGAQSGERAPLAFEVTSVKPSSPTPPAFAGMRPMPGGQRYVAAWVPLRLMIRLVYRITDSQLIGGPAWLDTERWDVEAKAEKPATVDQLHRMFQTLLADRFALKFHRETRTLPAYALIVDKGGSRMTVNPGPEPFDVPLKPAGIGKLLGVHVTMEHLCWFLSQQLNRAVIDKTGLDRSYDFTLAWAQEPIGPQGPPPPGMEPPQPLDGPTLFTALKEQLGLRLEVQKGPVEVFVIDHAERPKAN